MAYYDDYGQTKLHHAVIRNDVEAVRKILEQENFPVNHQDNEGMAAIHLAVANSNILELFIKAKNIDKNVANNIGSKLSHLIGANGNVECLRCLNLHCPDLLKQKHKGMNILHYAAYNGNIPVIEFLKEHNLFSQLNKADEHKSYPVHFALRAGDLEAVKYFTDIDKLGVFHAAGLRARCNKEIISYLASSQASTIEAVDVGGELVVDYLISRKALPLNILHIIEHGGKYKMEDLNKSGVDKIISPKYKKYLSYDPQKIERTLYTLNSLYKHYVVNKDISMCFQHFFNDKKGLEDKILPIIKAVLEYRHQKSDDGGNLLEYVHNNRKLVIEISYILSKHLEELTVTKSLSYKLKNAFNIFRFKLGCKQSVQSSNIFHRFLFNICNYFSITRYLFCLEDHKYEARQQKNYHNDVVERIKEELGYSLISDSEQQTNHVDLLQRRLDKMEMPFSIASL